MATNKSNNLKGPETKHWALLAYIAGDNDLSDYALSDITEMCKVGSSPNLHVGVQIDSAGSHDGLIRYEITEPDYTGKGYRKVIQRLDEMDSGSPECLSSFLQFGFERYPSKLKIGVVWSHGSGFKKVDRDIGFDYDSDRSMDMNEIISALTKGGITKKRKLSILGFDACLMAMLEVAHHLNDHAEILVGSQQTEPGNGWPYDRVLALMKKSSAKEKVAKGIVSEYIASYKDKHEPGVTQSAIDLTKTDSAIAALSKLGTLLKKHLDSGIKTLLNRTRIESQNFEEIDYVDAIDFARRLAVITKNEEIKKQCNIFVKTCSATVIHSDSYGGSVKYANGLSIWFPCHRDHYLESRSKYRRLKCNNGKFGWMEFLDEYYSS